jgi:hypothetical protein
MNEVAMEPAPLQVPRFSLSIFFQLWWVVLRHQEMTRPKFVEGGMASNRESSLEYIE